MSQKDLLTGHLRTTIDLNENFSSSDASIKIDTTVGERRYGQGALIAGDALHISRMRDGQGVDTSSPEFSFANNSVESMINYDSGFQPLTTVRGDIPFTVKAFLQTSVSTRQKNATARADAFDNNLQLKIQLEATELVPLPSAVGAGFVGFMVMAAWKRLAVRRA